MNINHINKSLWVLSNIKKYKGVLSPKHLQTTGLYQSQSLKSILHISTLSDISKIQICPCHPTQKLQ